MPVYCEPVALPPILIAAEADDSSVGKDEMLAEAADVIEVLAAV